MKCQSNGWPRSLKRRSKDAMRCGDLVEVDGRSFGARILRCKMEKTISIWLSQLACTGMWTRVTFGHFSFVRSIEACPRWLRSVVADDVDGARRRVGLGRHDVGDEPLEAAMPVWSSQRPEQTGGARRARRGS